MRLIQPLVLIAGIALLILLLRGTDLSMVWSQMQRLEASGLVLVLGMGGLWQAGDVMAWMQTFRSLTPGLHWFIRLFRVHVYGDALNCLTPLALGGEPMKAVLLHQHYEVPAREAAATLLLAQTMIVCAEVPFLVIGVTAMLFMPELPLTYRASAGAALCLFILLILVFLTVQRYRLTSRAGLWASRSWPGRRALACAIRHIRRIEDHLVHFYSQRPRRFASAVLFQFSNWTLGAIEIWMVLHFLGNPIAFIKAWTIESCVILVRQTLFLLPSGLGAQEGVFVLVCGAITGSTSLALSVALIRRARELTWICAGLLLGASFSMRDRRDA